MKNISTGFGLCAIAAAVALYPVLDRFAPIAKEAHAGVPVSAITSAVMVQAAPTIVWYGVSEFQVFRAWSNGLIEVRWGYVGSQTSTGWSWYGCPNWTIVNNPTQGLAAASDSDFNGQVDGADLGRLLGNWGDAPRDQIPTSDCPLNLINP